MASSSSKNLTVNVDVQTRKAQRQLSQLERKINQINTAMNRSANASSKAHNTMVSHCKKSEKAVDSLTKKIGKLAKAYLGVMGARAMITTSDTITKAENKLNNLEGGSPKATQEAMDKMYASSQRARTGYADMMSNVSKSMTLAGDAFQGNIDNAIRFQEIMAKSYTVGGASAAEQSSSMYQLIQALGSGVLQGDELRSVREGAPIAYKEIEKFAQGVYNTEESLKDLASQGKITSDIVVAAIMQAGDTIDQKFENTAMTFEQALTKIKNVAIKAFEPTLQMLNKALNSDFGQGLINGIGKALQFVAGVLNLVFSLIGGIYNFISDNWKVISTILMIIGATMMVVLFPKFIAWIQYLLWVVYYYTVLGVQAVASAIKTAIAWMAVHPVLTLIILILAVIIVIIMLVADSFVDACGIIVGSLYWLWAVFKNIFIWMGNVAMGLWESIKAIATNIGIAFVNCWNSAKSAFWGFIADCLEGLKKLEPAINAVAKAFGAEGFTLSGLIDNVRSKAEGGTQKSYVSVSDAWKTGYDSFEYNNLSDAYDKGYDVGTKAGQWITDKVSGIGEWLSDKLNMDDILGGGTGGSYDPAEALKGIGDTADNTGRMADSMDLTQEDLEYLRRVADMEWKKEFTTATIQVDMTNNNTLNGESDLDGIVTRLTDKLYEELDSVANGVYS